MTFYSISKPYELFFDSNGEPLENGYIYIGEANQNPITNPVTVYWDVNGLYPAAQPVRTLAGYPGRNGSPSGIFIDSADNLSYSILIRDKNGELVYSSIDAVSEGYAAAGSVDSISDLRAVKGFNNPVYVRGHTTIGDGGQGTFEYFSGAVAGTYSDDNGLTILPNGGDGSTAWIRQYSGYIDVKYLGAKCDATTDDFDAIRHALHAAWNNGGGTVFFPGPCAISKQLLFNTYDFIPTDPAGGGGDGLSVANQISYLTNTVPPINLLGATRPTNLINGNELLTKCPGLYWIGTSADDMIVIKGNLLAQWRGTISFKNLYFDGGDTLALDSATAALDGIWINQYFNNENVFKNLVITKFHNTGLRFGTNDGNSNNIYTCYFQNVVSNYNGQNGFVIKGNALTFDECVAERNATGGVLFRKLNNACRWLNGMIQFNTPFQIEFQGGCQDVIVDATYFEGQNHNTINAVNTANRAFIDINDGGGSGDPVRITIKNCRFVFGTTTAGYEEDYIVNLACITYGFRFNDNQINTENATIISNQGGGSNSTGGFFYNNYFSGGIGIVQFTNGALRDSFFMVVSKSGFTYFQQGSLYANGFEVLTTDDSSDFLSAITDDSTTGNLAVGTSAAPDKTLHVKTGGSTETITALLEAGGGGDDSALSFLLTGTQQFTMGVDATDNAFKIGDGNTVATNTRLQITAAGAVSTTGAFSAGNGTSGNFTTVDGKTVTVTNGIITSIV